MHPTPWGRPASAASRSRVHVDRPSQLGAAGAKRLRKIAGKALPSGSRYLSTVVESVEAALEDHQREHPEGSVKDDLDNQPGPGAAPPDANGLFRGWLDMTIPSLSGKTPKQAIRTKEGRELVEALLLDMEQREVGPAGLSREIVSKLRATLGLGQQTLQL